MLKYLFTVQFTDASFLTQPSDDKSVMDSSKSAFYDIINSTKEIYCFELNCQTDSNKYKIYPIHKIIEIYYNNKIIMKINPPKEELFNPRIIYYRNHVATLNSEDLSKQQDEIVSYSLGYQANRADGSNYSQIIEIF